MHCMEQFACCVSVREEKLVLFPFWTPSLPLPHCFPAASSFPFPLPITRPCHAASHALHLHLSLSGSLSPLPRLPGVNPSPASFSRQPSPYCWATSHSADPETQNAPPIPSPPATLRPLSVCLGSSPRCFLSCRPSFLTPHLPLISPLLAVAHIPFLMQCNL